MIQDAARNIHLRSQTEALLQCYAGHADHFRPSMELITRATGIPTNKISQVRKRLVDKGLISFDRQREIILIDWRRIRIFAALEKPLRLPNSGNYYFAPVRRETTVKKTLKELGRQYRIRNPRELTPTEVYYYDRLEQLTELEFLDLMRCLPDREDVNNGGI